MKQKPVVKEHYTADFTAIIQVASDGSGHYFKRTRGRTPWGYAWSRWKVTSENVFDNLEHWRIKNVNVRLPRVV